MAFGYNFGGYPSMGGYFAPPMPDQLAQLRGGYQSPMSGQQMMGPQMQPMAQQTSQVQPTIPTGGNPIWVNGEEGAKAYLVEPGHSVLLMDADANIFYLKSADANGMPAIRVFDYTERNNAPKMPSDGEKNQPEKYVTAAEFDALAAKYDELAAELEAFKSSKAKKAVKEDSVNA